MKDFSGCKLSLMLNGELLVYQRDFDDMIPFPGMFDLPGGGREGGESPIECVLRELEEEFGIRVPEERLSYCEEYALSSGRTGFFFVGEIRETEVKEISFGNEGVAWKMMPIQDYLQHDRGVPHLKEHIKNYLEAE